MATKTPSEIVADKIATQKLLRAEGFFRMVARDNSDAKAAQLEADAESGRLTDAAIAVAQSRHMAAMADYKSGNAEDRAIAGYKVKRAVAHFALSEGRRPSGELLPVVATVAPTVGTPAQTDSAPVDSSANAQ